jgi:RNA polymerase sigma-32 factor
MAFSVQIRLATSEVTMGSFEIYRARLAAIRPLEREEERALVRRWRAGDKRAGERLVEGCLPFVLSVAFEYRRWGVPIEDIVQQGNIGLLRAVAKFDLAKECRLATYAAYWIRAEIREYVVRAYRVVRLGTTKAERRALRAYRRTREQDPEALARASGLTLERARLLLPLLAARETRLDANSNGARPADLREEIRWSPEEEAGTKEVRAIAGSAVRSAVNELPQREQTIVRLRMMGDDPLTLHELGARLGVSKERVRQLEERAKGRLKDTLTATLERQGALEDVEEYAVAI